jgi:tetratricopeptide (TPR) repeat protein
MLILLSMILFAQAEPTVTPTTVTDVAAVETPHPGPRSSAEAQFLFKEGSDAFAQSKFDLAQKDFERLIDRYPSHSNAFQSYPNLIVIYSTVRRDHEKTIRTIKKYLLLKPDEKTVATMKNILANSYLETGKLIDAKITSEEVLRSKEASTELKAAALLTKTEVLSRQKKFKDANAAFDSLDSLEVDAIKPKLPGLRLTLNTRECDSIALPKKKKYSDDDFLGYFGKKDTCLKEALPTSLNTGDETPMHLWCQAHESLAKQLDDSFSGKKMDPFLKKKITQTLSETESFAKTLNAELVHCL